MSLDCALALLKYFRCHIAIDQKVGYGPMEPDFNVFQRHGNLQPADYDVTSPQMASASPPPPGLVRSDKVVSCELCRIADIICSEPPILTTGI